MQVLAPQMGRMEGEETVLGEKVRTVREADEEDDSKGGAIPRPCARRRNKGGRKMRTNLDKWNYWKDRLDRRDQTYILSVVGPTMPEPFYRVECAMGTPEFYRVGVSTIIEVTYHHQTNVTWLGGGKPTNGAILALRTYVEGGIPYNKENIRLHWQQGRTSGAIKWLDFVERKGIYTDLAEATAVVEAKREQHIKEKEQIGAGTHTKCSYCGKVRQIEDIHYARIWSPNWQDTGGQSPLRSYCKDKPCASYDQMAHEG
jgi:hypothetical protein